MGNTYSYRHDGVGVEGDSGSGGGAERRETGPGAELDVVERNPSREDAEVETRPGLASLRALPGGGEEQAPSTVSSAMPSPSSSSQEESFFGWRRKSEEEEAGGNGVVGGQTGDSGTTDWSFGGHGDTDTDGRLSLAETIPLEEAFPEMRLEVGASDGKLQDASYEQRMDAMTSRVPQGHDKPMKPNVGSSSGTRSVASGGSQSVTSHGGKEGRHRGSFEVGDVGDDGDDGEDGYGMQRRASGASARGSLALERANARANRSSFDAFQKALEDQVRLVHDGK